LLRINEIFGPTVQGEGSAAGQHCLFVRTALCNLECLWCDTDYTWAFTPSKAARHQSKTVHDRATNIKMMSTEQVLSELRGTWDIFTRPTNIIISGGEPLLQAASLEDLVQVLDQYGNKVHIETAGTIVPTSQLNKYVAQYNVSPKLAHSGNSIVRRYNGEALDYFVNHCRTWWKFVVTCEEDFAEIDLIVGKHNIPPNRVMMMPEGMTIERNLEVARRLADHGLQRGYGISLRTHILLWPDTSRGR
jgi:7-carboxy-7-deazaguanine synthase